MYNLCNQGLSPRMMMNIEQKPKRDDKTATMLENRSAIRSAVEIQSCVLPTIEAMNNIFGVSK